MHEAAPEPAAPSQPPAASSVAPWWHTAIIALLIVGVALINSQPGQESSLGAHHIQRYFLGIGVEWLLFVLVWWGLRMRRVALNEILGLRPGLRAWGEDFAAAGIFWAIAIVVLACVGVVARLFHLSAPQKTLAAIAPRNAEEMLLWIALSCTAGFVEEFVFRGYLLRQFARPARALWVGVVVSSLIFGIAHGYEGVIGMIAIGVYGALFCVLAILRRTLRPGMIAHAWHDIFSGAMLALAHHLRVI